MFKHWTEIVRNHANGYSAWSFYQSIICLRESNSILSGKGKGKGFTLEELLRSPFTEL